MMRMKQIRKAHRAACWIAPAKDEDGKQTRPGHHHIALRAWLRAQKDLHAKLTGKARSIVVQA